MRRLVIPLALVVLCLSGCQTGPDTLAAAADSPPEVTSAAPSESPTPETTPSATSTPTPIRVISPDVRTRYACSVAAGKFPTMTKGVRFTAKIIVVNRGNIGASTLVKVSWSGRALVHRGKKITVGYGKKVKLILNAPTTPAEVTAFRAKRAGRCVVTAKVLSFAGKPRPAT